MSGIAIRSRSEFGRDGYCKVVPPCAGQISEVDFLFQREAGLGYLKVRT